ncbi:MAG: GNAT family N-acetyltransferase [Bacteroidota bacterium]|nr:GNAT family N-acetyltransferase [Bacteroidota bacterium]
MSSCHIRSGSPEDVIQIFAQIPEFDNLPDAVSITSRLKDVPHLILLACIDDVVVGFKIGYERDQKFYSWLGAIHPDYRRMGIAADLAMEQENWARSNGYKVIWMKSRNRFPSMLIMALNRGFNIICIDAQDSIAEHRIIMEKSL